MKIVESKFADCTVLFHIGQNAKENDRLVEISDPSDLWFHAKHHPSCHVIALISDKNLQRKELQRVIHHGSLLCKQNTKRLSSTAKVEIMYTQIKNVERTKIAGTVLTKEWKEKTV